MGMGQEDGHSHKRVRDVTTASDTLIGCFSLPPATARAPDLVDHNCDDLADLFTTKINLT